MTALHKEHLIRDEAFDLEEHLASVRPTPAFDHATATAANPLAYTGCILAAAKPDLNLSDYVDWDVAAANVPVALAPEVLPPGFQWGMLLNDKLGDCVPAEVIHSIETFHIAAGTPPPPFANIDALHLYEAVGGYNPNDPNSDQGTDPGTAWNYWKIHGVGCHANQTNHQIKAVVGFNPAKELERHLAIYEFDAAQYAIALPMNWQGQPSWTGVPSPSDPNSAPGSWGGHGVCARAYDAKGNEDIESWGEDLLAAGDSLSAYLQQAAAVITHEQTNNKGVSRCGVQWDQLVSDIAKLPNKEPTEEQR